MRRQRKTTGEKFFIILAAALYAAVYYSSPDNAVKAINYSIDIFFDVIALVIAGICLGGLVKAAMPDDFIPRFMGQEKGLRAYFNSIMVAGILPGEAYVRIPLFEALLSRGAGLGPFASLNTSRPMLVNFPQGVAFLGLPIAIVQVISTVGGALIAGLFAAAVQRKFGIIETGPRGSTENSFRKSHRKR